MFLRTRKFQLIALLIFIIASLSFIFLFLKSPNRNETETISKEILNQASLSNDYLPENQVYVELSTLSSKFTTNSRRYEALKNIFVYFDSAYFNSNDPEIRKIASSLDNYAKNNFKDEYKPEDFSMPCADSKCGEPLTPEIQEFIKRVEDLPIEDEWKTSINLNIKTASYTPFESDFDKMDKMSSYSIAILELETVGASEAAKLGQELREYIKNKYNKDL